MSAFKLFRGSAFGFFSRSEIKFFIRFAVTSAPFLLTFVIFSPPQVLHVEMPQTKCTRELSQLVETKGLGEDFGRLSIRGNIHEFHFTREDTLADKMIVHLYVLSLGMEDEVLCKLDVAEVVIVNCRWIRLLHPEILK